MSRNLFREFANLEKLNFKQAMSLVWLALGVVTGATVGKIFHFDRLSRQKIAFGDRRKTGATRPGKANRPAR
jgi:hypothetical protein